VVNAGGRALSNRNVPLPKTSPAKVGQLSGIFLAVHIWFNMILPFSGEIIVQRSLSVEQGFFNSATSLAKF